MVSKETLWKLTNASVVQVASNEDPCMYHGTFEDMPFLFGINCNILEVFYNDGTGEFLFLVENK